MAVLGCGTHRLFIYERGGVTLVGELIGASQVKWSRVRDDISNAQVDITVSPDCCELVGEIKTVLHELHIWRDNGEGDYDKVWEGPITRLEYGKESVSIVAQDILWPMTRRVLHPGYDYSSDGEGSIEAWIAMRDDLWVGYGFNCIDAACPCDTDLWRMEGNIVPIMSEDPPKTARAVADYSRTVWEDFDKYAEDGGMDYTVVLRTVYFWDTHLHYWKIGDEVNPITLDHFTGDVTIVEYGSELATRSIYSNGTGSGTVGVRTVDQKWIDLYGCVDEVRTPSEENASKAEPTPEATEVMVKAATRSLLGRVPPPVRVRVSSGAQVMPVWPTSITELRAGTYVFMNLEWPDNALLTCKDIKETTQRIDTVEVTETQGSEVVAITLSSAGEGTAVEIPE